MKRPLKRGRRSAFALRITYRTFFENARRRRFCRYLSMRSWRVGSERGGASPPCCCCVAVLAVVRVEGIMCTVWPTPNSAVQTLQSELLLFVSLLPKTATSNSPSCPFPVFPAAVAHLFLHSRSTASRFSTRSNFGLAVLLTTSRTSVASNVPYTRGGGGGACMRGACIIGAICITCCCCCCDRVVVVVVDSGDSDRMMMSGDFVFDAWCSILGGGCCCPVEVRTVAAGGCGC
mmetsp:Transcript_8731/g.23457  ORF Transcript_8731/g.23457 Transcript_8731/m.23457 type:complete len:233 (+) Transcript_8731:204-902(+)